MKELETILKQTFDDFTLSSGEKFALKERLVEYADDDEALHFARNRAFDIVKHQINTSQQYHFESVKWLEKVVKLLDQVRPAPRVSNVEAYFSPGTECMERILSAIERAKHAIQVCVFTISDDRISHALLGAHEKKVHVRVITDDEKSMDRGSDVTMLERKGVPVKYDNDPGHMHHKFAVFDETLLIHGSFNWTRSASSRNWEDISVNTHPELVTSYVKRFEQLWKSF